MIKQSQVPQRAGKTSFDTLNDIPVTHFENLREADIDFTAEALLRRTGGLQYDLLWRPKKSEERVFVLFSGDAKREQNNPPVFQRWSWAPFFPGHCLYISDPTLFVDDELSLAWYAGNQSHDPIATIAGLLKDLSLELSIPLANFVLYGSSGGGFAGLKLGGLLQDPTVVAINPQTNITNYYARHVNKYFEACWPNLSKDKVYQENEERFSLLHPLNIKALRKCKIVYVQNKMDHHHVKMHYAPFLKALDEVDADNECNNLNVIMFEDEGGHARAENPDAFKEILDCLNKENL